MPVRRPEPLLPRLALLVLTVLVAGGCGDGLSGPPEPGVRRETITLIARGDGGRNGKAIGCGDSAVPVTVMVRSGAEPLPAALELLLELDRDTLAGPDLLNPLYHSDLRLAAWRLDGGRARVDLEGDLRPSPWPCNALRVRAQLMGTVLAVEGVEEAEILVNGEPLDRYLDSLAPKPGERRSFSDTGGD